MADFDALLFDLDGVVYVGPSAVAHAAEVIGAARALAIDCGFVTNNAARMAEVVADHLCELGIPARAEEVITSPQAAVSVLGQFVPTGSRVLVIGGAGIADELSRCGYVPVRSLAEKPAAIMQGFSPDLTWRDLAEATYAVRAGLPWIATNLDFTFPTPGGAAPGNGSLVRLVADVTGREPAAVAGKPEPPLLNEAITRLEAERPLMIGDRLDTDIEAGARVGIPSLLVMTGVATVTDALSAEGVQRPSFIGADLRVLLEPYPQPLLSATFAEARCGDAVVRVEEGDLVVDAWGAGIDALRAAATLCWAYADLGESVSFDHARVELERSVMAEHAR